VSGRGLPMLSRENSSALWSEWASDCCENQEAVINNSSIRTADARRSPSTKVATSGQDFSARSFETLRSMLTNSTTGSELPLESSSA
jgi:hypothetical protein